MECWPYCPKCRKDMRVKKNGVEVGKTNRRIGDLFYCPSCGNEVLLLY